MNSKGSPPQQESFSKFQKMFLLALVLLGAFVRVVQLDSESLWYDETLSVLFATQPIKLSFQSMHEEGLQHSPLYYILLRPFLAFGSLEVGSRILSAILGVLAIPMMASLGRALHSPKVGILSAALLSINPFHVWYSREARMYSFLTFAALGGMYFFVQSIIYKPHFKYWVGLTFFIAIGINTHHFAFFIPLVQLIYIIFHLKETYPILKKWAFSLFLSGLTLLPWMITAIQSNSYYITSGTSREHSSLMDIPITLWNFSIGYSIKPDIFVIVSIGLFVALLFIALKPFTRRRRLLFLWLFLPPCITFLISFRLAIYMDRYLIVSLPAFILLLSIGLASITRKSISKLLYFLILISTITGLSRVFFDDATYERADWRELGKYLEREVDPLNDTIATLYYQDLIPLHFYFGGSSTIEPIISFRELNLPNVSSPSLGDKPGHLWLILPHPNPSNHLVGHCKPFENSSYIKNVQVIKWRDEISDHLVEIVPFTCIRLEKYSLKSSQVLLLLADNDHPKTNMSLDPDVFVR